MTSGPPGPPPFPPGGSPPEVPFGWRAEWSDEYQRWYFFNQATQTTSWENPLNKAPAPPSPPPYAGSDSSQYNRDLYGNDDKSSTARGLLGHVFGHHHSHSPPINQQYRPNIGSAQLFIHAACFSDQDITQEVRDMVTQQQTLTIHTDALTYHFGDPWPNHRKQFSILYSYGQQPWQVIACVEGNETINLHPSHPVDRVRAEFVQQPTSRVVALVWGVKNALAEMQNTTGQSAGMKMMEIEREGRVEANNAWMGFDGNENVEKMAVVYFRNPNGSIGVATAREGETVRLPWNAFAGAI